jgi:hypothetical protein
MATSPAELKLEVAYRFHDCDRAGCGPDAGKLGGAGRVRKTDPGRTYGMSFTSVRAVGRSVGRHA